MEVDVRFRHPFSMVVSGPSFSGKSHTVSRFVEHASELMTCPPTRIFWHYTEWQPSYEKVAHLPNVELIEGVPDTARLKEEKGVKLCIMDDMMSELSKSDVLTRLFTRGCHHWDCSCIFISQNAFFSNMRNARINASYLMLFKSPSDKLQIANIGRQLYPGKSEFFMQSYNDATEKPFSYLLVDLTQTMNEQLRLRAKIFPSETLLVYLPKL